MQVKNRILRYVSIVLFAVLINHAYLSARDFIHIFTGKGVYETCEDLWFKCLVLNDSTFDLSDKNHTAFVEIVNPKDSVVWKEKYPVVNGACDGQIYVGDDWETGVYRMYVNTSATLGKHDTVLTPKNLLIVNELPEAQTFVSDSSHIKVELVDSIFYGKIQPLTIAIVLDSAEYHIRSKVRAKIKVTDTDGNPVSALVALSVYDRLYSYRPGELDLLSHCVAIQNRADSYRNRYDDSVLSDGPVAGYLRFKKKKKEMTLGNQFINVFDYSNTSGSLNVVTTDGNGRFEIPSDVVSLLGWNVLMKPLSGIDMKPELDIIDSFDAISEIRKHTKDIYYPALYKKDVNVSENDTFDYAGRRTVRLDEVVVKGRAGRYPRRNKLLGYLDSISTGDGGAWVCGCPAGQGTTFLNDYVTGYTHHPEWNNDYQPRERSKPIKGKRYELIKYNPNGGPYGRGYVEDIRYVEYQGPKYSEDELLRMNGMWKAKGYYPRHYFFSPDEVEMSLGLEDGRNNLLWLPDAMTDENGELLLEFFTSDIKSLFVIKGFAIDLDSPSVGVIDERFHVN